MSKKLFKAFWKTKNGSKCKCFEKKFLERQYRDDSKDLKAFVHCQKHEKEFVYYCSSHNVFCCVQCNMEGHENCSKEKIDDEKPQEETVDELYLSRLNLREYVLELSSQIAGLSTPGERLEYFQSKESEEKNLESIQLDIRKQLIECAMFEAECLNLMRVFRLSSTQSQTDRRILLKTITVLNDSICEFLRAGSKLTERKYTQKRYCLCGTKVQDAQKTGKLRAVILDTAVTDITHRFVNDLEERLKNKDVNVAFAGPLTEFKIKDESLPLLVVCAWDTRLEQDVHVSLKRVQGYGLHRVGLLVLCLKGQNSRSSDDQNQDLGYLSYISCISGHYELSKKQLKEIKSFLIEQKASGTPV